MKMGSKPFIQPTLLFFGSFLFAGNMNFAAHEIGHWIADRHYGVDDVRIFLHPFIGSRIIGFEWHGPKPWPLLLDASGLLLTILIGAGITLLFWRKRNPYLLPLLVMGPLAWIMEGFGNSMGLLVNDPGTDPVNMVAYGIPRGLLLSAFVLIFTCGIVSLLLLFPLLAISPEDPPSRKLGILSGAPISVIIGLIYVAIIDPQETKTSVMRLAFAIILISLLVALDKPLHPYLNRVSRTEMATGNPAASWVALVLGIGITVLFLLFFN